MAREQSAIMGIALIDLDGFKPINDQFGHAVGDKVLMQVAHRLSVATSEEQLIARLGGDEFGAVTGVERNEVALGRLRRDLGLVFSEPFFVQDMAWRLSASIGTAIYPADGGTLEHLMETRTRECTTQKGREGAEARSGVPEHRRERGSNVNIPGPAQADAPRHAAPSRARRILRVRFGHRHFRARRSSLRSITQPRRCASVACNAASTSTNSPPLIENWRRHYNAVRPHSSLGYRPPAPEALRSASASPTAG